MAVNKTPIFVKKPQVSWGALTTANVAKDGTGTVVTIFTAGPDGAFLQDIVVRSLGTNTATVLRIFINNGDTNATASNNTLYKEFTIPGTTLSEVAALPELVFPINRMLPLGYKVNVTIGTTVAAGLHVTALGGSYTE